MHQLFLFTGENTFTLAQEVKRWKEEFREKYGEANLQFLTTQELSWPTLLDEVTAAPFLSDRRLVVVEGIPKVEREQYEQLVSSLHPATILVFVEPAPDRRSASAKFLLKAAQLRTFRPLTVKELTTWIIVYGNEHGAVIDPPVARHLIERAGEDQWHLRNEVLKLVAFTGGTNSVDEKSEMCSSTSLTFTPTIADVDRVCIPSGTHAVWTLSDLIGKGKTLEALTYSARLCESGEDVYSLWNIFLWIVRNIATLWIVVQEKPLPAGALAKEAGIPYPSVQSLLPLVRSRSADQIRTMIESAVDADRALKTGEMKASAAEPIELIALLEREILRLAPSQPSASLP